MPEMNITLPTPDPISYPMDKGSNTLIGSYNMSFANLTNIVKYATGHFSSEAAFLAKQPDKSNPRYNDNAIDQLKSFMQLKPIAVSLQEMVVHSFQDEFSKDPSKDADKKTLQSSAKAVFKNGAHFNWGAKVFPVFSFPVESDENPQTIPAYLQKIINNHKDYDVTYGTVVAGNVGESAVILTRNENKIENPKIYNIGHNELVTENGVEVQKGTDARPVLIAKYGDVLLVNLHAPNKPQVPDPIQYIKDRILLCIEDYIKGVVDKTTIKDVYLMGDFNDKLNEFGTLEIKVDDQPDSKPLVISHGSAPVSCCYNWNSASYIRTPKPLPELKLHDNNADMSLERKECVEEMSQLYPEFGLEVPEKFLKSIGSQDYLFGMPLMREQGNLLNYLFTGDYCFSKGNANPIKIFRNIEVPNITFPYGLKPHERYNYLLHVYRNTDPLTRKKIYYSLNMDSKESDHEMVYLDTQPLKVGSVSRFPRFPNSFSGLSVFGTRKNRNNKKNVVPQVTLPVNPPFQDPVNPVPFQAQVTSVPFQVPVTPVPFHVPATPPVNPARKIVTQKQYEEELKRIGELNSRYFNETAFKERYTIVGGYSRKRGKTKKRLLKSRKRR